MKTSQHLVILIAVISSISGAWSNEKQIASLPHSNLDHLLSVIKPQPKGSPWREINWITNVTVAREKAIAEDKPLVIFTAADGSPIGRT